MTTIFLYANQQSPLVAVVLWVAILAALVCSVILIIWQQRKGKELEYELSQLGKIKKRNVEYEFVLKSMRLSTWHIDVGTRQIVFDNDFRDKNDTYVPPEGGTTADLAMTLPEQDRIQLAKVIDDLCSGRKEEACLQYHVMLPHSKKKFYWSESYAIVAERDADVLHAVVVVDPGVALARQRQIEAPVSGKERQHVVEKADAGVDLRDAHAVEL